MTLRSLARLLLVCFVCWTLGTLAACASFPGLSGAANERESDRTSEAPPRDPTADAPPLDNDRADYRLEIEAPAPLRNLLVNYLDLARFQNAPQADGINETELERLLRAAPAQARGLLETEGYFNADVKVERVRTDGKPVVRIVVDPGPPTIVRTVSIEAATDPQAAARGQDPAMTLDVASVERRWPLKPGMRFRQAAWSDAKNTTLALVRADGYAAASWSSTHARIDAPANRADLSLVIDSGPLFRTGEIRVIGIERYDADVVRRLAAFSPGTPYSERLLLDYQERLLKAGLFEGASVEIDADPQTAAAAPITVRVRELTLQQATVGVGISANTGARLTLEHTHRRVFGTRWIARNKFELGPTLQSWQGELTSYPREGLYRDLVSGSLSRLDTADEVLNSWSARIGRTQDTPRIERLYFAEISHATLLSDALKSSADAVSGNYHWVWRNVDNVLLPTRGMTVSAQAALGYGKGRRDAAGVIDEGRGPFGRAYARLTWYRPFGGWYTTFRVEAGEVFTRDVVSVPETLLFRAGGDESVRGYGYRTLGPIVNGKVAGGRTLVTGSAEIARPILSRYPAFWWAAFVDAGNAADSWADLKPAFGYGVGVRWRSPVGPLSLDLAYGQDVHRFRLHLSVGVSY